MSIELHDANRGKRGTGRTTRMVADVARIFLDGSFVGHAVICGSERETKRIRDLVVDEMEKFRQKRLGSFFEVQGAKIVSLRNAENYIMFVTQDSDLRGMRSMRVFVDHYAMEKNLQFQRMFKDWCLYDQAGDGR